MSVRKQQSSGIVPRGFALPNPIEEGEDTYSEIVDAGADVMQAIRFDNPPLSPALVSLKQLTHIDNLMWNGYNPLCMALAFGQQDAAKRVLDAGANLFHRDNEGDTVMHQIVRWFMRTTTPEVDMYGKVWIIANLGGEVLSIARNTGGKKPVDLCRPYGFDDLCTALVDMETRVYDTYRKRTERSCGWWMLPGSS